MPDRARTLTLADLAALANLSASEHQPQELYAAVDALVQTVIQTYSPAKFRGRTMAIFQLSNVVMTIGSMLLGTLATALGTQRAVGLMGAAGALMMLFVHVTLPRAWRIR